VLALCEARDLVRCVVQGAQLAPPDTVGLAIGASLDVDAVIAAIVAAIDQDLPHASRAHLAEADLLLTGHLNASMTRSIARCFRFLTIHPVGRSSGTIGPIGSLRDQALKPHVGGGLEWIGTDLSLFGSIRGREVVRG